MQIDVLEVDGNYYGMYFSELCMGQYDMIFCFSFIASAYHYKQSKQKIEWLETRFIIEDWLTYFQDSTYSGISLYRLYYVVVIGFSGCHRYEAHQRLGLPTIRCKIRRGTKETLRLVNMFG